jgi:hypothetical protein
MCVALISSSRLDREFLMQSNIRRGGADAHVDSIAFEGPLICIFVPVG